MSEFKTIDASDLETASGGVHINMSTLSPAERWVMQHESGGNTTAKNPHSSAFGLGQLIYANRVHYLGRAHANTTDPGLQLKAFRAYIHDRYGNANRAEAFWKKHHWY